MLCGKNGEVGLLGMDLYFANLVEDVTYYSNYEHFTYAFIINLKGTLHCYFNIVYYCLLILCFIF